MNASSPHPVVTAIIPTYRRPPLLKRAIYSVLNQTYPHVRVCVYDNASGDDTRCVVETIAARDNRLRYHCHMQNVGSYNNFNYGLREVDTPYFVILSDDDMFAPMFLEQAVRGLEHHKQAAFLCMPSIAVDLDGNVVAAPMSITERTYEPGEGLPGVAHGGVPATWSGILFRKRVRDGIGLIDLDAGPYADAGYIFRAVARFPFVVVPGIAAVYVVHGNTTSTSVKALDGSWPGWWDRMARAVSEDPLVPASTREAVRAIIYPDFRRIGVYQTVRALGEGRADDALQSSAGVSACGYPFTSRLLRALVWVYSHSALARRALTVLNERRKSATRERRRDLHAKFGHHVEFIKQLDQVVGVKHV